MNRFARALPSLILILLLGAPAGVSAQEDDPAVETVAATPESPEATAEAPAAEGEPAGPQAPHIYEVRTELTRLLGQYPRELAQILVLDPSLLGNDGFLADYPELQAFLAAHPEVRRSPRYYLAEFSHWREPGAVDYILEPLLVFAVFLFIALALAWLVRTIIEQKRWNRLARTQSEVHNKILDRFGTSEELLEYVRTPAGTRFLESAPIPLHAEEAAQRAPLTRVLWSIQIGVVVAAAALGMLVVSAGLADDGQAIFSLGVIALSVGLGFVGSAAVSLVLSRRLGLWQMPPRPSSTDPADGSGLVK